MFKKIWSAAKWLYNNFEEIKAIVEIIKNNPSAKAQLTSFLENGKNEQADKYTNV